MLADVDVGCGWALGTDVAVVVVVDVVGVFDVDDVVLFWFSGIPDGWEGEGEGKGEGF